jgi:hypothetical protein
MAWGNACEVFQREIDQIVKDAGSVDKLSQENELRIIELAKEMQYLMSLMPRLLKIYRGHGEPPSALYLCRLVLIPRFNRKRTDLYRRADHQSTGSIGYAFVGEGHGNIIFNLDHILSTRRCPLAGASEYGIVQFSDTFAK